MAIYIIEALESISYDDWDNLQERLKAFPKDTVIHNAKSGWAQITWSDRFIANNDNEAIQKAESEYISDVFDLYEFNPETNERRHIKQFTL
jgi:hypothetical protein